MTIPVNTIANDLRGLLVPDLAGSDLRPGGAAIAAVDGLLPKLVKYVQAAELAGKSQQLTRKDRTSAMALYGYQAGYDDGREQASADVLEYLCSCATSDPTRHVHWCAGRKAVEYLEATNTTTAAAEPTTTTTGDPS